MLFGTAMGKDFGHFGLPPHQQVLRSHTHPKARGESELQGIRIRRIRPRPFTCPNLSAFMLVSLLPCIHCLCLQWLVMSVHEGNQILVHKTYQVLRVLEGTSHKWPRNSFPAKSLKSSKSCGSPSTSTSYVNSEHSITVNLSAMWQTHPLDDKTYNFLNQSLQP